MSDKPGRLPNGTPDLEKRKNVFYEPKEAGNPFRQEFVDGVTRAIDRRMEALSAQRKDFIDPDKLAADREGYRAQFIDMLGWPLNVYESGMETPACRETFVERRDGRSVYRLQIEVMEDVWFYGMLFVPDGADKWPLVISQHGGGGSPELCSDFNGDNNYRHMTVRAMNHGAVIFAPQMMLWNIKNADEPTFPGYGIDHGRSLHEAALRRLGGTVTAFELYCIRRSLDYLVTRSEIDPERIGMVGCSYGGMYALLTAAVEPRVKAAYPVAYLSDWQTYKRFNDMCWHRSIERFTNAEIIALVAPRAVWLECGDNDNVLPPKEAAKADCDEARRYFEKQGAGDRLHLNIHHEGHRLAWTDEAFDFMFKYMNE